jgi:hypothetical protein
MATMTKEQIIDTIKGQLETAKQELYMQKGSFTDMLKTDPVYAMEWGGRGMMQAGCKVKVLARSIEIAKTCSVDRFGSFLIQNVLRYSRPTSSCPISNLKDAMMAEEWARLASQFDKMFDPTLDDK